MKIARSNFRFSIQIAAAAIFAALVLVATAVFPINIPATSGYFNFGETILYIAALFFGPLAGALSGGIGAATADVILGYSHFAPGTLIIKSIEGAIVGLLYLTIQKHIPNQIARAIISILCGGIFMVTGYFAYEQIILGYPITIALAEVPFNIIQMIVGLVIAIPIMHIILRVLPQPKSSTNT